MGCAIRSESRSGTGVGPGVRRRIFFKEHLQRGLETVNVPCQGLRIEASDLGPQASGERSSAGSCLRSEARGLALAPSQRASRTLAGQLALVEDDLAVDDDGVQPYRELRRVLEGGL